MLIEVLEHLAAKAVELAKLRDERDELRRWQDKAVKDVMELAKVLQGQPEGQQGLPIFMAIGNYIERLKTELMAVRAAHADSNGTALHCR